MSSATRSCSRRLPPARTRPSRAASPSISPTRQAVLDAAERIGAPFLVQPFVRGGAELLAGAVQDPVFGPLVAFGPGGVLAELIGEAQFRLAPLTDLDAEELVHSGKAGRLVAGFRGTPPADEGALVDLLLRLSLLVEELPEVVELDLNPVPRAAPDRCFCRRREGASVAEHGPAASHEELVDAAGGSGAALLRRATSRSTNRTRKRGGVAPLGIDATNPSV